MKKIVILSNDHSYTYNFRKEIIQKLIDENYKVYLILPYGSKVELLKKMGCEYIDLPLDRRGMNPKTDLKLLIDYFKAIKKIKPDLVFSYTIKPNIYGGIACRIQNIPFIPNVTGLGTAVENKSFMRKILLQMYKIAYRKADCIFFQNQENLEFFCNQNIKIKRYKIIPGSGVNVRKFKPKEKDNKDDILRFLFIARLMKDKGIEEYLEAAENITKKHSNIEFQILGPFEDEKYKDIITSSKNQQIKYLGISNDVRQEIKEVDCIVNPSYHEGMSNVLLEGAAMGKPLIASNISGCREIIDDGVNGYLFKEKSAEKLEKELIKFIKLDIKEKKTMGENSRKKVKKEFDRNIVVNEYMKTIAEILN